MASLIPEGAAGGKDWITPDKRKYHSTVFGKNKFKVDVRYQNISPVGSGSYGIVVSADDTVTGLKVAIKKITDVFEDLIDAKRILRELKLLSHLGDHENVIGILDIMTQPPNTLNFKDLYIVTECYECDLDRIITSSQVLTDGHCQYFLYQLLRGMKYMHSANVLHRDLKPSNVLVNANCDLALCDFGLARGVTTDCDFDLTEYVVTRWYRAPELLCQNTTYGKAVDIWALGCIFAELMMRKPLLQGRNYLHQLKLITKLLGKPRKEELNFLDHEVAVKAISDLEYPHTGKGFDRYFPHASPQALDLLTSMLQFNPQNRCTVEEALAHPYLAELHRESDEPLAEHKFNFDFELFYPDEVLPKAMLQDFMYKEMLKYQSEEIDEEEDISEADRKQNFSTGK